MSSTYLTPEQVHTLNEKHGWFEYADAQSDVSKAFAQDAIEMHERIRAAAPDLLKALMSFPGFSDDSITGDVWIEQARAAILKATKEPA